MMAEDQKPQEPAPEPIPTGGCAQCGTLGNGSDVGCTHPTHHGAY